MIPTTFRLLYQDKIMENTFYLYNHFYYSLDFERSEESVLVLQVSFFLVKFFVVKNFRFRMFTDDTLGNQKYTFIKII